MAEDCIFCRIISGDIPSDTVFEDEEIVAFRDVHPLAPTHVLVVPRRHIESVNDLSTDDAVLLGRMILVAQHIAAQEGVSESGYRLVVNSGPDSGQAVAHLHLHVIGGRALKDRIG
ncbi:MAG: histidine triad nucleotide-binding protein [Chloroflexota bacterium]